MVLRYQIYQLSCVLSAKNARKAEHGAHEGHAGRSDGQTHRGVEGIQDQLKDTRISGEGRTPTRESVDVHYGYLAHGGDMVESYHHGTTGNDFFAEDPFVDGFVASNGTASAVPHGHASREEPKTQPSHETSHGQTHGVRSQPDLASRASFIKWVQHLARESLVIVTGTLQRPANAQGKILEASEGLQGVELAIGKMFVVGRVTETPPFKFTDIRSVEEENERAEERDAGPKVTVRNELNNRVFDLRVSPCSKAVSKHSWR